MAEVAEIQNLKDTICHQKEYLQKTAEKIKNVDQDILDYKNKIMVLQANANKIHQEIQKSKEKSEEAVEATNKLEMTISKGSLIVQKDTKTFQQQKMKMENYEKEVNDIVKRLETPLPEPCRSDSNEELQQAISKRITELNKVKNDIERDLKMLTDDRDAVNLEICNVEAKRMILQNHNAAKVLLLRKRIQASEHTRQHTLEKLEKYKKNTK